MLLMYFKTVEQFITTIVIVAFPFGNFVYILKHNTLKCMKYTYISETK